VCVDRKHGVVPLDRGNGVFCEAQIGALLVRTRAPPERARHTTPRVAPGATHPVT
jgi:hypothetical protein